MKKPRLSSPVQEPRQSGTSTARAAPSTAPGSARPVPGPARTAPSTARPVHSTAPSTARAAPAVAAPLRPQDSVLGLAVALQAATGHPLPATALRSSPTQEPSATLAVHAAHAAHAEVQQAARVVQACGCSALFQGKAKNWCTPQVCYLLALIRALVNLSHFAVKVSRKWGYVMLYLIHDTLFEKQGFASNLDCMLGVNLGGLYEVTFCASTTKNGHSAQICAANHVCVLS